MKHTSLISLFVLMLSFYIRPTTIYLVMRNMISNDTHNVKNKYKCNSNILIDITVVVSIKDTCSQTPAFLRSLKTITTQFTPIVFTYPNSTYCKHWHTNSVNYWNDVTVLALESEAAPMNGWIKAIPYIRTKYSYLVHNDGYALDNTFLCELKGALYNSNSSFVVAAPMLYENDNNNNLMAHATQSSLQVQPSSNIYGSIVFHEHSFYRALNRGADIQESEQTEFLEDHGFLIQTNYIQKVIDPNASFTLEYLDMILNLRHINKKIIFVPSARLEFRVTKFDWSDIPHFVYKRSEEVAHDTMNYISNKWMTGVPNTGVWTYIKYTILEQHTFTDIAKATQLDQLRLFLSFFHLAGFNRYSWDHNNNLTLPVALNKLEYNRTLYFQVYRDVNAKQQIQKPTNNASKLVKHGSRVLIEIGYYYNPFMVVQFEYKCNEYDHLFSSSCNMILKYNGDCKCWLNIPVFKQLDTSSKVLKTLVRLVKIPERVVTYFEMLLYRNHKISNVIKYKSKLKTKKVQNKKIQMTTYICEANVASCLFDIKYDHKYRITKFYGGPSSFSTYIN